MPINCNLFLLGKKQQASFLLSQRFTCRDCLPSETFYTDTALHPAVRNEHAEVQSVSGQMPLHQRTHTTPQLSFSVCMSVLHSLAASHRVSEPRTRISQFPFSCSLPTATGPSDPAGMHSGNKHQKEGK